MVYFLELVYFACLIKAILRCLYFWQLKEYRLDRFKDLIKTQEIKRYFLFTRHFLRPKITLKTILLTYLSLYLSVQILKLNYQVIAPILAYLLVPLTTVISVFLIKPFSDLTKWLIVFLAGIKLSFYKKNLKIIGITGSFAKTSTKEILSYLLSQKYQVLKTAGTNNTLIGVALTILKNLRKNHQVFVVEMGAYTKGEIKQIAKLVKPQIGILTGITKQHLSLFNNLNNLVKAKYELIKALPKNGLAVFNLDDPYTKKLYQKTKNIKKISCQKPKVKYKTNLKAPWHQLNIQTAVTVAKHLKVSKKTILKALKNIPLIKTDIKLTKGLNQAQVYNHTYNSNPIGFAKMIDLAKTQKKNQKLLITSGIIELGSDSKKIHHQLIKKALKVFDQVILTKSYIYQKKHPNLVTQTDYKQVAKSLNKKLNSSWLVVLESRMPQKFIKTICQNPS